MFTKHPFSIYFGILNFSIFTIVQNASYFVTFIIKMTALGHLLIHTLPPPLHN